MEKQPEKPPKIGGAFYPWDNDPGQTGRNQGQLLPPFIANTPVPFVAGTI